MLNQAVLFLLDAIVGFFSGLCLLRFLMQALRVSFSGPLGHAVLTLSNWAVLPLRRIIPPAGTFDSAEGSIECMLHGARFDIRDGRPLCPPAYGPVAKFPVEVRDGGIWTRDDR